MLVKNARTCSLAEAVKKTFDGEHPCALCRAINSGHMAEKSLGLATGNQNSKQNSAGLTKSPKPDLNSSTRSVRLWCEFDLLSYEAVQARLLERREAPPLPPPRLLSS